MSCPNVLHLSPRVHLTCVLLAFGSSLYYKAFQPCSNPRLPFLLEESVCSSCVWVCSLCVSIHNPGLQHQIIQCCILNNHLPAVGCDSCCLLGQFCLSTNQTTGDKWPSVFLFPNVNFLMRWKKGVLRLQPCVLIHPYLPWQQEPRRHLPQLLPIKPISVQWNFPCQRAQTTTVKWWWERMKWRRDPKSLGRMPWHPLRKWGGHKPVWGTFVCSNFYLSNSRQLQPRVMESIVLPFKWHLLNYWKNWCLRASGLFSISELSGIQPLSNCLENTAESLNIMWQTAAFFHFLPLLQFEVQVT